MFYGNEAYVFIFTFKMWLLKYKIIYDSHYISTKGVLAYFGHTVYTQ